MISRAFGSAVLAIVLIVGLASPAAAQRTGSRMGKNATADDLPKAMRIMADCIAGKRNNMLRQFFGTLPGSAEESRIIDGELGDLGLCLEDRMLVLDGKQVVVTPRMIRFPFALAKARRDLRATAIAPAMNKDQAWFAAQLATLDKSAPVDRVALGLQDFGHCVAATDWVNARALVLSEEGSAEQKAAVAALTPVLGPCLPSDVQIKLNAANLRSALAEPMVHALQSGTSGVTATR